MLLKSLKSVALITIGLMLFSSSAYSQSLDQKETVKHVYASKFIDRQLTEQEVGNLLMGIRSDNLGLRRSAIYLSGLYGVTETVPALIEQLKKEENADMKVLTALVLYILEDPKGIEAVEELYRKDDNIRVKRMSKAILDEFKNLLAVTELSER